MFIISNNNVNIVNGIVAGIHLGKPMQDAKPDKPEDNESYFIERNTQTRIKNSEETLEADNKNIPLCEVPNYQLVTDNNGNMKWEDKPFYETFRNYTLPDDTSNLASFIDSTGITYYKVTDNLPTVDQLKQSYIMVSTTGQKSFGLSNNVYSDDTVFYDMMAGAIIVCYETTINHLQSSVSVPETGIYLSNKTLGLHLELLKCLDAKYIPSMNNIILNSSTTSSSKKFKITVDDTGTISATEII